MRRAARVDNNQVEIVTALKQAGATVQVTSFAGEGMPDLLVGFRGLNFMLEVKDGQKPPSAQALTPAQIKWHRDWRGQVTICNSVDAALKAIGAIVVKAVFSPPSSFPQTKDSP